MKKNNWLRNKLTSIAIAMSNVEKNVLTQNKDVLLTDTNKIRRNTEGQLADSLINGEVTQEVIDLRWRMYKILNTSKNIKVNMIGIDSDGNPIIDGVKNVNPMEELTSIAVDPIDNYPLEMVIDNTPILLSMDEALGVDNEVIQTRYETPIQIERNTISKFDIERYATKLHIRKIDDELKLIEFYINKDYINGLHLGKVLNKELNKLINNEKSDIILIDKVLFTTFKSIGVDDFLFFEYAIESFDKITEFNNFFILKFIAKTSISGKNIFDIYKSESLEEKYKRKDKKI